MIFYFVYNNANIHKKLGRVAKCLAPPAAALLPNDDLNIPFY